MLRDIFQNQGTPAERPLLLTGAGLEMPVNIIRRKVRRDPGLHPGDEIYDRARVIFSRARRTGRSRATNIF